MRLVVAVVSVAFLGVVLAETARAAPCDRLTPEQRKVVEKLQSQVYPYDCCDETLAVCLKQKKVCKLARRLRDDLCRRAARGQDPKEIKSAMDRRARSMTPGAKPVSFDLAGAEAAGAAGGKVTVVVYACATCPFCSKVVPELHRLVTGPLKGRTALYLRPFPIRGHAGSAEAGIALVAAQKLRKYWPYVLHLYANFDKFAVDALPGWAEKVGLSRASFMRESSDAANREVLVRSKKEGLRNKVDATPTVFINGRKYFGDLDPETLLDVLDEEADRAAGQQFCDGGKATLN